jgi:hypothetical protein
MALFAKYHAISRKKCIAFNSLFFHAKLLSFFRGDELQSVGSSSESDDNIANADDF